MKKFKTTILVAISIFTCFWSQTTKAQNDELTYQAYIGNSQTLWERAASRDFGNNDFDKGLSFYGLLNYTMSDQNEELFDKYYDQTLELFEKLIDDETKSGESRAILGSTYGYAMAYSSWKGVYLGPKSSSLLDKAISLSPNSALVHKLYGGSKLYTPSMFGGDVKKASEHFNKSVVLFEAKGDTVNNWLYLDALAHLGIAYNKLGKYEEAIQFFEKSLVVEPNFGWVKYNLLPSAKNALAKR